MESATKKSLLGKYQLIKEFKENRPNNNKPQYILLNVALTIVWQLTLFGLFAFR